MSGVKRSINMELVELFMSDPSNSTGTIFYLSSADPSSSNKYHCAESYEEVKALMKLTLPVLPPKTDTEPVLRRIKSE